MDNFSLGKTIIPYFDIRYPCNRCSHLFKHNVNGIILYAGCILRNGMDKAILVQACREFIDCADESASDNSGGFKRC